MKEQDFGYISREGWDGCVDEGAGYAIEGDDIAIEGWSY